MRHTCRNVAKPRRMVHIEGEKKLTFALFRKLFFNVGVVFQVSMVPQYALSMMLAFLR